MTYVPSPHFTQNWVLSKPSAQGRRGIVVAQVRSAAEAGVAILDAGGNAVDAAVGDGVGAGGGRTLEFRTGRDWIRAGAPGGTADGGGGRFRSGGTEQP